MIEYWYTFKHRIFPKWVARAGKSILQMIARTCKFEMAGQDEFCRLAASQSVILSLWHNRLPFIAPILERAAPQFNYAAVISDSRDGEIIASIARSYPQATTLRMPKRSLAFALKKVIEHLREHQEIVVITPDGPRGPRYKVKPGIILAAMETRTPIVGLTWEADRCWRLKTWDAMMIPKPFSTIKVTFLSPIVLDKEGITQESAIDTLNNHFAAD